MTARRVEAARRVLLHRVSSSLFVEPDTSQKSAYSRVAAAAAAAVWGSCGDQLGCVARWQQWRRVKIESNQGRRV